MAERSKILVIDDDSTVTDYLSAKLGSAFQVISSNDSNAALERAQAELPDLIMCDVNMPGMDGEDVLKRIISDPRLRDTPVIMVSSAVDQEGVLRCIESGAIDYLQKPVKPVLLRARLTSTLARKRWRDADRHYRERLEAEKRKSDTLLLNILPRQTVMRLSAGEDVIADAFDDATVLFSDFEIGRAHV